MTNTKNSWLVWFAEAVITFALVPDLLLFCGFLTPLALARVRGWKGSFRDGVESQLVC